MENNEHTVYMLRCKDNTIYTGYTNHLENRLRMHEEGKGAKYTRGRGPFTLLYCASFSSKREALREEYRIKQLTRIQKERLINSDQKGMADHEDSKKLSKS
ncbi:MULTISPECIES: GIY-YIG nuclease family protein [Pontibacillus]|uniref:GIY-YIG nuclease family protein n=1 Tax=Pontibacillus chungwhensis TaxID=265426 RepID=A0ABY8V0M3_9BACI|nr:MULTISPECIES: GIY-YIG nuclease family protein [Pontibacillus]MCD5326083.1 GIY-YIG nuclease family protein [Pontibacillus sp. HN14]WIF98185.1 GIY-YIG nuclease family protein [Pontibacillus chungwhensis]